MGKENGPAFLRNRLLADLFTLAERLCAEGRKRDAEIVERARRSITAYRAVVSRNREGK